MKQWAKVNQLLFVVEAEMIMPSPSSAGRPPSPELELVTAVLADALLCVSRNQGVRRGRRWREFVEAYNWFWDERRDWPFAFRNVCDLVGLDAGAVRQRVQHLATVSNSSARPPLFGGIRRLVVRRTRPRPRRSQSGASRSFVSQYRAVC